VHEVCVRAVAVQKLHAACLGANRAELLTRAESAVDHRAVASSPQLCAHERAALAGLYVLELEDLEDGPLDLDVRAVSELIGADHHKSPGLSAWAGALASVEGGRGQPARAQSVMIGSLVTEVRISQPLSVTTTRSSIRIPKRPGR